MFAVTGSGFLRESQENVFISDLHTEEGKEIKAEELYDTYGSFIYYTALKYLGDGHLAQDCTQQSMERLMKYADRLGETEAKETKSYIYRLTVSTALNMKKQQDRMSRRRMRS